MKLKTMSAALLLTLPFWACAKDVTIIYTNDLHAHVEPYKVPWIADGKRDIGGWANITTMVKQEKAKNNATWFFDAGDYFTGPYISSLTKGKAIIDIMNTMSYDAVTIGNHEFDHGWDNTLLQLSQATFPIVQGNIFYQNSDKSFWDKPYTIIEKDGVKIGVIGLHGVFAFNDTVSAATRVGIEARDERILYISCNPETLCRNLETLSQTHNVTRLALFDQFPYTHHMECGVLLTRK